MDINNICWGQEKTSQDMELWATDVKEQILMYCDEGGNISGILIGHILNCKPSLERG